jgi:multicomponent Na+:H+ antiporter subunit C
MEILLAVIIGILFGAGVFMLLRRNPFRIVVGVALLSNAINLLIFTAAGLSRASPPLVPQGAEVPPPGFADPLPQALILTAIVISFAVLAFTIVLFRRTFEVLDLNDFTALEKRTP